jgi:mannose/fructose/N-acetylgalactosamine-specific phosphotransferase system component IIC
MAAELLAAPGPLILLLLLGGWTAVDGTGFGQFMISRPFVAATLGGWVMGDPVAGAQLGLVLEAFHLGVLPVGAARFPEGGPAAVVSGAVYASAGGAPSVMLMSVVFALAWEWISGAAVRYLRQGNVHLVATHVPSRPVALEARHLLALLIDFARGMVLVGAGIFLLAALVSYSQAWWPMPLGRRVSDIVLEAALVGLLAATSRIFGGRARLFTLGAVAGVLFLLARS